MLPSARPYRPNLLDADDAGPWIEDVTTPIVFGAERLRVIQRRLETQPWAARLLETMRTEADRLIDREAPALPAGPLGSPADFRAADGTPFVWQADSPEAFWNPLTARHEPGDGPARRAWSTLCRRRTHRLLRSLALLFRLTGDDAYAAWVADGLRRAAELDQADGLAVAQLAVAYDLVRRGSDLSSADHRQIAGLFERLVPSLVDSLGGIDDPWSAAGIGLAGNVLARTDWIETGLDGEHGLAGQLLGGVGEDGLWFRGDLADHFSAFCALVSLYELARALADPVAEDPVVVERLTDLLIAPARLVDFAERLPAFGETAAPSLIAWRHCYEYGAGRLRQTKLGPLAARLAQAAGGRDGWTALAFAPATLPAPARRRRKQSLLPGARLGIFRDRETKLWVALRADPLDLAIHAAAGAVAPGGNHLLIDGRPPAPREAKLHWLPPYAEAVLRGDGWVIRRRVWFQPPFIMLDDACESDAEHRFTWQFGAAGPLRLDSADDLVDARWRPAERLGLRAVIAGDGPLELDSGATDRRLAVRLGASGRSRRFRAVFEVYHGAPVIEEVDASLPDGLAWRVGDEWYRFALPAEVLV